MCKRSASVILFGRRESVREGEGGQEEEEEEEEEESFSS